ncbi:hypothetical protein GCM10011609_13660 [Lentzea pudingi]|uniref:Sensory transduction regulator n=1 Tax=Lentzea pudingi TaxID=1789439 RepID=A0ABQ2HHF2_9PSEU|nr:hypothetical protein [Lentzea pudingi]GGM79172.1 hypothetical protein GCM10011609_13660 [Lentzea pudingi]
MSVITLTFDSPRVGAGAAESWDKVAGLEAGKIREIDLRYKLFKTEVIFEAGGVELIDGFRLTLVDLALGVMTAVERLKSEEDSAISFTESADVIYFDNLGDIVQVRYLVGNRVERVVAYVSIAELLKAMHAFVKNVYERLTTDFPGLAENPVIQRLAPRKH